MRHIKKSDLRARIKEDWLNAAAKGLNELKKKRTHVERSKFIARFFRENAKLWTELKLCMAQPVPAKCWYSEVQSAVSELEIDHFRPKNSVYGIDHEGYWWLAFEWENFRISSPLANKRRNDVRSNSVGGKGTYFPLLNENKRVAYGASASTKTEKPLLLDPFEASDVLLLDYDVETGKTVEKYGAKKHKVNHARAKKSIELYHLNNGVLIAQRAELAVALKGKAERVEELFAKVESNKKLTRRESDELAKLQNEIAGHINATAQYSAFFRALLKQLGNRGWNEELLTSI